MRRRFIYAGIAAIATVLAVAACSSSASGTLAITVGGESDALTKSPAPTKLTVDAIDADGGVTNLATATLPTSNLDLGDRNQDTIANIRVNATDDTGKILLTGMTLPIQYGALSGTSTPVFIQRNGEFARMPSTLGDSRSAPVISLVIGQYILFGGGTGITDGSSQLYDTGSLSPYTSPPTLPRVPASIANNGTDVLVIDANGGTWLELSDSTTADAPDKLFHQHGRRVFKDVVPLAAKFITEHLGSHDLTPDKIGRYWLHQANQKLNELVAEYVLGRKATKVEAPIILDEYGNTASAGSLLAFSMYNDDLPAGTLGIMSSFGAGYSLASLLLRRI